MEKIQIEIELNNVNMTSSKVKRFWNVNNYQYCNGSCNLS